VYMYFLKLIKFIVVGSAIYKALNDLQTN